METGLTIDRIDVYQDYEPDNCRWTNTYVQNANKRDSPRVQIGNISLSLYDWFRLDELPEDFRRKLDAQIDRFDVLRQALKHPIQIPITRQPDKNLIGSSFEKLVVLCMGDKDSEGKDIAICGRLDNGEVVSVRAEDLLSGNIPEYKWEQDSIFNKANSQRFRRPRGRKNAHDEGSRSYLQIGSMTISRNEWLHRDELPEDLRKELDAQIDSCEILRDALATPYQPPAKGHRSEDLTGKTFGLLTVLCLGPRTAGGKSTAICSCRCGNICSVRMDILKSGRVIACGCMKGGANVDGCSVPGSENYSMYQDWMHVRFQSEHYHLPLCSDWTEWSNFREWSLVNGYRSGYRIILRDTYRGYVPDNCVWAAPERRR